MDYRLGLRLGLWAKILGFELKAEIQASRLDFGPHGLDFGLEAGI